jgi:peptidyl-tRNA hydrolase
VKIGIGRPEHKRHVPDHVLSEFEPEEEPIVAEAVERAADRVQELLSR